MEEQSNSNGFSLVLFNLLLNKEDNLIKYAKILFDNETNFKEFYKEFRMFLNSNISPNSFKQSFSQSSININNPNSYNQSLINIEQNKNNINMKKNKNKNNYFINCKEFKEIKIDEFFQDALEDLEQKENGNIQNDNNT